MTTWDLGQSEAFIYIEPHYTLIWKEDKREHISPRGCTLLQVVSIALLISLYIISVY